MRLFLLTTLLITFINASFINLDSFEADFSQTITDEKNKVLKYNGHILASKPYNATWQYTSPIKKDVYISKYEATAVEPEIEQVIIRKINSEFDFFQLIKTAKKSSKDTYVTKYNNKDYTIKVIDGVIKSISFLDQFENKVKISFSNQKQNHKIEEGVFIPKYPVDFDIIRD